MSVTLLLQASHGTPMLALGHGDEVVFDSSALSEFDGSRDYRAMLEAGFAATDLSLTDLTRISCDIGPGGLGVTRTAAAFANALGFARDIPIYPVRAFDLLGAEFARDKPLVLLRRAGRPYVHFGLYENGALARYAHIKEVEALAEIKALSEFDFAGNVIRDELPQSLGTFATAATFLRLSLASTEPARAYPIVEELT